MKFFSRLTLLLALPLAILPMSVSAEPINLKLDTSKGEITIELYPDKAPITVENFLKYAKAGHYDGVIFHRVIPGFMIQTGGYDALMVERKAGDSIKNEAENGLKNDRGTLAMARQRQPDSARVQWFINLSDNAHLNHKNSEYTSGWGYAVFGKVTQGMAVVDEIAAVETTVRAGQRDVPVEPVMIRKVTLLP